MVTQAPIISRRPRLSIAKARRIRLFSCRGHTGMFECPDGPSRSAATIMKIDIFNHFYPRRFFDEYINVGASFKDMGKRVQALAPIYDLDIRFRAMDEFGDFRQVLTMPQPPVETLAGPDKTPAMARVANDGLAELVNKYPKRFIGFGACLPMNNPGRDAQGTGPRGDDARGQRARRSTRTSTTRPLDDRRVSAGVRRDGAAQAADLAAPDPRRRISRLPDRGQVAVRDLVDVRLAVRDERRHGAPGVLGPVRSPSGHQDHHAPRRRDDSVLRRARRLRMGSAGQAHVRRGLHRRC